MHISTHIYTPQTTQTQIITYTHTHTHHTGIHECSVMNRGCRGNATLCLISNSIDGVCQCPAWMAKRIDQDGARLNHESCIGELACLLMVP